MADRRVVERLFQQYSPDLAELLNHCVPRTTIQLYSKNLVTKEVKEWTQSAQGVSDFEKAVKVLSSAETILKHSPDLFNVFLSSLIAAESSFDDIVEKISKDYEKLLKVADEPKSASGCADESQNSKILDDTTGPSTDEISLTSKETPSGEHSLEVAVNLDSKDTCPSSDANSSSENLDSKDSPDAKSSSKPDVGEKIERLESVFLTLIREFVSDVTNNAEITPSKVLQALTILPLALQKQNRFIKEKLLLPSGNTGSVEMMLAHVTSYTTFLDFALIKHLIETFGSEKHKQDISAHASSVEAFKRETTVQELIDHWPGQQELPSDAERLVAVIDADPRTYSLLKLDQLRKRICISINLSDTLSIIIGVAVSNSFILTLMVPSVLLDTITPAEMLGDIADVTSLMIEGQNRYLYLSPAMSAKKAECEEKLLELCVNSTGDISEFSSLLGQPGVNPNFHDEKGRTLLMFVSYYGRIDIAQLLIEYQCDVNIPNENGATPLYVASQKGHKRVVDLLLDKGANVDQQDKDGHTALRTASFNGHTDVVRLLVTRGATVNIVDKDGGTPLIMASQNGHKGVVDLLLNKGANVDQQSKDGNTSLIVASVGGHKGVVDLLLDKGANVDQQNKDGHTALRTASFYGHRDVVRLLVTRGATVNIVDKDGATPLHLASQNGHKGVVDLLLDKGANVDQQIKDGSTPLMMASLGGHKGVVDLLLDKGANIDQQNKDGHTALRVASFDGHRDVVRLLITRGATVNIVDKDGHTPLYVASQNGHKGVVDLLLDKGANVDQQNKDGHTPLYVASYNGQKGVVDLLLDKGANIDKDGMTPLYLASQEGHEDVVALLLDKGANVDQQTKDGFTPLYVASQKGHKDVVDLLLDKGANIDQQNKKGSTPLIIASQEGHTEVAQTLISKGAAVDHQDEDGWTALHFASAYGHPSLVDLLVKSGSKLDIQTKYGRTALCWASHEGEKDIVEILVNAGANLNIQDEDEMTALTLAIQQGHKNIAFTLIKEKAADLNITDKTTGWSAIFFTAKQGFTDVARQLLDRGADVTLKDKNGVTAFNIAKLNNNEEICDLLMNYYNVDKTEEKVTENQKKQVKLSYQRLLSSLAKRLLPGREEKRSWKQSRKNQNQREATTFNKEEEDIVVAQ